MPKAILTPEEFFEQPESNRWFSWDEIEDQLWERKPAEEIVEIRDKGGIYIFSRRKPRNNLITSKNVIYIGETGKFKNRMYDFGKSAGLFKDYDRGEYDSGHGPAFKGFWPKKRRKNLLVGFYIVDVDSNTKWDQLNKILRLKYGHYALVEFYKANNSWFPEVNDWRNHYH